MGVGLRWLGGVRGGVVDLEAAERQLNGLVEKRAKERETANREVETWRQPTRRRRERMRRDNARAWAEHYASMARAHHDLAAKAAEKADRVLVQLDKE